MNNYENGSNGINRAVQVMALQALHRAWQESSAGAPSGDAPEAGAHGRRRLQQALFFLICVVPMALLVLRVVAF
jgi:hypothetical protein